MVDYVALGNVPAEEIFGSKENLAFILHGMNCGKRICLIIAALEKADRGVEWVWNKSFPEPLVKRVAQIVAQKLTEDAAISLPDLTEHVLKEVYNQDGTLKKELRGHF